MAKRRGPKAAGSEAALAKPSNGTPGRAKPAARHPAGGKAKAGGGGRGDAAGAPPVSREEIAESQAIARRHYQRFVTAMRLAGLPVRPEVRARLEGKRHRPVPTHAIGDEHVIADRIQRLSHHCRRGDCRRFFQCRHGERAGEDREALLRGSPPPCLSRIPRAANLAMRFLIARSSSPRLFREPDMVKREVQAVAIMEAEIAAAPMGSGPSGESAGMTAVAYETQN
ncbi:hypothetical protein DYI37_09805 [Fulvimarina endophytica]|uniref:Uncharacterized protein n=1 Tax=Fulvimarina endophytica TaxID=2293836 RepID=A0A371X299_9HYPH|nr:hypothetical protein [Fulvimarina endophytica]RFC63339.1 hypothetical protein DYI37_09805 [Fulvimarina endophytica]